MKIYFAGMISGNPNYKADFERHAIAYEAEGHIGRCGGQGVFSPGLVQLRRAANAVLDSFGPKFKEG